jgi:hypothetical protein
VTYNETVTNCRSQPLSIVLLSAAGLLVSVMVSACGNPEDNSSGSSSSNSSVASPTGSASSTGPTASEEPSEGQGCRPREQRAFAALEYPLQEAADRVLSAVTGKSPAAADPLARRVDKVRGRLLTSCSSMPTTAASFFSAADRLTSRPLNAKSLDELLAAYARWATPIGEGRRAERIIKNRKACLELARQVRTGYAVWWEPTPEGKDMWVQLIVHNDTAHRLAVSLWGSLWATGVLPKRAEYTRTHHGVRDATQWTWGGSSADSMYGEPHARSTTFVGIGETYKLHMTSDGYMFDIQPVIQIHLYGPGTTPYGCSLPVVREN